MNPKWAEENLQTIRTLMERSALYRRALAPIMICVGALGSVAAIAGYYLHYNSLLEFEALWVGTAFVAIAIAFLIARRQAIKDRELFWSPPTRRVIQAIAPALAAGAMVALFVAADAGRYKNQSSDWWDPVLLWLLFYGCALHAAGFFTPKGIKWLGWFYVCCPAVLVVFIYISAKLFDSVFSPNFHCLMGALFGGPHLAYGIYLYFTEKKNPAA